MNMKKRNTKLFDRKIVLNALRDSFKKLNPKILIKSPIMFIVELCAVLTTIIFFQELLQGRFSNFNLQISIWLWFTVLFANFSEAVSEGKGKAHADALRESRTNLFARKLTGNREVKVPAENLMKGDRVVCETDDIIPTDGEVIEGIASVDESAITGESAPVIRESGGDRSSVTGGTKVLSDRIVIKVTAEPGNTFMDRLIILIEGAKRQKTPNEISLTILLAGLTIIFLLAVATIPQLFGYASSGAGSENYITIPILISLLVCLIPTTIGGLLSAIGISGINRLVNKNVIATSGRAVEAAGDLDVLLLDKTGTITFGNRMATEFIPADGVDLLTLAEAADLSSLSDETPEGRSILKLAKEHGVKYKENVPVNAEFILFSAETKMSGINIKDENQRIIREIRKGAEDAIDYYLEEKGIKLPIKAKNTVESLAKEGNTPLVVIENNKTLGVIRLKDVVKGGIKDRFQQLRTMGIKTVMITGDNQVTAAAIAAEAGVDDFIAQAKPEDKLKLIRGEQAEGHMVGMIGDGTNDAPALAQADVGIAMNSGTQAAREAGNMVDLDNNPTKLLEVVEVGKQLLMTRGSLTTFSIANDVAKYFAILPAIFGGIYTASGTNGPLSVLNIMKLYSPESAILSAVIFNALIIISLIPLALRGVKYKPIGAKAILQKNMFIYGFGGLLAPFAGIKIIDLIITGLKLM